MRPLRQLALLFCTIGTLTSRVPWAEARDKTEGVQYGTGLIVSIPAPEAAVVQAVEEVVQNGIIRGSKEYNKDEYISGATAAPSSRLFGSWSNGGVVFYKVRFHALDPRNFKDSGDVGTLAVRYVVMRQDDKNTTLRIDALFAEDFRHTVHPSNGSVEGAEYKDIHDHIEAIEQLSQKTADESGDKQESVPRVVLKAGVEQAAPLATQLPEDKHIDAALLTANPGPSSGSLDERVQELRRQVERTVKAPGAPLKSAPFHSATNFQYLPTGTEVLIVISTPYWYGVETHEGQHGWMLRDELEQLP